MEALQRARDEAEAVAGMLVGIGRDGRSREITSVSILNDETKSVVRFVPESALSAAQVQAEMARRLMLEWVEKAHAAQAEMRERAARLADENIVGMEPDEIDDRNAIALAAAIRALPLTPASERDSGAA